MSEICKACNGAGGKVVLPANPMPTEKGTWVSCKPCNGTGYISK